MRSPSVSRTAHGGAVVALDRLDADAEAEARAEGDMRVEEEIGGRRRHGAAERPGDLDHRHFAAQRQRRRGDFEADEAGADDDDAPPRAEPLADRRRVGDVAQAQHAVEIGAGNGERPRPRAGGEDQVVERLGARPRRARPFGRRGRCASPATPSRRSICLVAIELLGPQRQAGEVHLRP